MNLKHSDVLVESENSEKCDLSSEELSLMKVICSLQPRNIDAESAEFPGLPASRECPPIEPPRVLKICIVTQDIVGPIRNGGIGTAYRYAAELLSKGGHNVTILYGLGDYTQNGPIEMWVDEYAKLGINFVPLPEPEVPNVKGVIGRAMSRTYGVYEWLKTQHFDLVHVSEWQALGYYSQVAKHLGIAFQRTLFCVKTSSPSMWNLRGNDQLVQDQQTLIRAYMERKSVELADIVISGSAYMLRWMLKQGYQLPQNRCYVQPNIMPAVSVGENDMDDGEKREINEIVFFGRLEPRKGLHLFCDALRRLNIKALKEFKVTFLGKHALKYDSEEVIEANSENWTFEWQVIDDLDQPGAIKYLSQPGRLAVMPSVMDNSPFGVYECLSHRIPFITSDVGGGIELITKEDHAEVIFPLQPTELMKKLQKILTSGIHTARPSYDMVVNNYIWLNWHNDLGQRNLSEYLRELRSNTHTVKDVDSEQPLVSVCIPHHDRPRYLRQALNSVLAQDYKNLEVIVVDDGSGSPEAKAYLEELEPELAERNWKLLRQENLYVAAARNLAARNARGKYLYFLDDDNFAKSNAISTLVDIAERSGAEVLTCFGDLFSSDDEPNDSTVPEGRHTLVGDNVSFGAIANGFGDTHSLVLKEAFEQLGGYKEEYGVGKEDMEFFAHAVLKGFTLYHVPEALYWYRRSPMRIRQRHYRKNSGDYRVMQTYLDSLPHCIHPLLMLAQGQVHNTALSNKLSKKNVSKNMAEEVMVNRPFIYHLGRRILRLEIAAGEKFLDIQLYLVARLYRTYKYIRNLLRSNKQ